MSYKIKTRIYYNLDIIAKSNITLDNFNSHHLANVLKIQTGEFVSVFNEISGEFVCKVLNCHKKNTTLEVLEKIKDFTPPKYLLHLAYAPLKKDANDFVIEKSCELGVSALSNIITNRCVNKPLEVDKIKIKLQGASSQCGRLDIPQVLLGKKLVDFVQEHKKDNNIFWLNEFFLGDVFSNVLQNTPPKNSIILIGPEGGFDMQEKSFLSENTIPCYIKGNILRAETASIVALVNFNLFCN